ncbi:hypothetical protein RhiirC2_788951 [Rhizophagus irregularis]|uniref:Uncharacterized protein n=1 Tax=Rhizophagus irregularis TaxID=588596 RepID=A0A2N1MP32_9GLOM|nr:hypothetical protein RhiirC2_788951 [Rhizophagus irregularis]
MSQKRTVKRETKKTKLIDTSEKISANEACEMYKKNFYVCNAEINLDPLPAIPEPVRTLKRKSVSDWTEQDVMPLAELLAGRIGIDGIGENFSGASAFGSISEDLSNLSSNIQKSDQLLIRSTISSPPLALFPGTNHIFVFNGPGALESAQHFMGWLQGTYVGLQAILQNSTLPATLF